MTKLEAIEGLKMYERMCCFEPKAYWSKYDFAYKCYAKSMVPFVIDRIQKSHYDDPIMIIRHMKMDFDEMIGDSNNKRTWEFCSIVCKILDEIIYWLI